MAADDNGNNGDKKEKDILVDPEQLITLANQLSALVPDIQDAKTRMDSVNLVAGLFWDAQHFKDTIGTSENGRATIYSTHLQNLQTALNNFSTGLHNIAKNYDSAEAMNKNLVQQLAELKQQVDPYIPNSPNGA
jgi:hypothetical protein